MRREELNTIQQEECGMLKSHPEEFGISTEDILCMIQELETFVEDIHSITVVCDNDVILLKCIEPYNENAGQMMHSFAKSINSMAVGIAIEEGGLGLNDHVLDYFREYLPKKYDPRLEKLTVRNLLTMSASSCRLSTCFRGVTGSWISHYFTYELPHDPGSAFQYDTGASYMLSSLVTKVMGKNVFELMKERVFGPMGITNVEWLESPEGNTVGGWGLYLTTPDIAKIAILLANRGKWNGIQLVPEKYLEQATTKQIETPKSESLYGYGYQFWMEDDHAFCVYGAFGNVIVVNPVKRMAVALTAGAGDKNGNPNRLISRIVNERLFKRTNRKPLPVNEHAEAELNSYLRSLVLPCAAGERVSELEEKISEKVIAFEENECGLQEMTLKRTGSRELTIRMQVNGKLVEVQAGFGKWISQEAVFDDKLHFLHSFSYSYNEENNLLLKHYPLNMSGYELYTLHFEGETVNGIMTTSVKLGGTLPVYLSGKIG